MSRFLNYDERVVIQRGLEANLGFGDIGLKVSKDRTTIAKEIRRHIHVAAPGKRHNSCVHRFTCTKFSVCQTCKYIAPKKCHTCALCNANCPDYEEEICLALFRPPYVCNGCSKRSVCTLTQRFYDAWEANEKAKALLTATRSGIRCTENDIARINANLEPIRTKKLSVHAVYVAKKDVLMCSEKTLYNYIDSQILDVINIDLPRKVKFSLRKKAVEFKVDRACRVHRAIEDFRKFLEENPEINPVQMDSVIGKRGGKMLLTIYFVNCGLMLAFLRDFNTAASVEEIFNLLDYLLGPELFEKLFPVILTDNGSEFSNPIALEERHYKGDFKEMYEGFHGAEYDKKRTKIFYCDSMAPNQKGAIEVNHEFIRRILPKGSSFDNLTQDDVNKMMNHINSYPRKKLNDRTPYEMFVYLYGVQAAEALGLERIAYEELSLSPSLLK